MADTVFSRIRFEPKQLQQLLTSYADLLERVKTREPDLVELTALASVLHSFYSGLENIFIATVKAFDRQLPHGRAWHRDLLRQVTFATETRPAMLSEALARRLNAYLTFRRFYRHSYSFILEWEQLEELVDGLDTVWQDTRREVLTFFEGVEHGEQT